MVELGTLIDRTVISNNFEQYGINMDKLIIQKDYEGIEKYIAEIKDVVKDNDFVECGFMFYYIGTGYCTLCDYERKLDSSMQNVKANGYRKQAFYYFRKAIELLEKCEQYPDELLLIYTNYANALDSCGRVIEALRIYRKAVSFSPQFGMALGNYGRALEFYANTVNDSGQYKDLHCHAYQAMVKALSFHDANMHEEAVNYFERKVKEYQKCFNVEILQEAITYSEYDLGIGEEVEYRKWCLENHLFLNPHNDLIETYSAFAHDPLTITRFTENIKSAGEGCRSAEPPRWYAMLNQIKEEYIYARYLCFDGGKNGKQVHYADKEVKLSLSSYEYVNYSIRIEQIKSAYKTLFSILDQIAFFINDFWDIGLSEYRADAKNVFASPKYPHSNVAMVALYWGYCEFSEKYGEAKSPFEKDLKTLRNALEHKFVKVHAYQYEKKIQLEDDNFYHISEDDLINQTKRLLQLAREWIMELVYAIGIEESKKEQSDKAISLSIVDFDDEWKL